MFLCSLLLLCVNVLFFSYYFLFYKTQTTSLQFNTRSYVYNTYTVFYSVQTVVITQNCSDKTITGKVRDLYLHEYLHFFQNSLCHKIKLQ